MLYQEICIAKPGEWLMIQWQERGQNPEYFTTGKEGREEVILKAGTSFSASKTDDFCERHSSIDWLCQTGR